jgi:hypothetical protein
MTAVRRTIETATVFAEWLEEFFRDDAGNPVPVYVPAITSEYAGGNAIAVRPVDSPEPYPAWNVMDRFYVSTYADRDQDAVLLHLRLYDLLHTDRGDARYNLYTNGLHIKTIQYERRPGFIRDENNRASAFAPMFLKMDVRQTRKDG